VLVVAVGIGARPAHAGALDVEREHYRVLEVVEDDLVQYSPARSHSCTMTRPVPECCVSQRGIEPSPPPAPAAIADVAVLESTGAPVLPADPCSLSRHSRAPPLSG